MAQERLKKLGCLRFPPARMTGALALLAVTFGCARATRPCQSPGVCPEGFECSANRCTVIGKDPAPRQARRTVIEPRIIRLRTAAGPRPLVPSLITLGSERLGDTFLYLDFEVDWSTVANLTSASLVMQPAALTIATTRPIPIDVYGVRRALSAEQASNRGLPNLRLPAIARLAPSDAQRPLRIDLTDLVRKLEARKQRTVAVILVASAPSGPGLTFAGGLGAQPGPRLELYQAP